MARLLLLMLCVLLASPAWPHAQSNAFIDLKLDNEQLTGVLLLRIEDIALFAPLDTDRNREITWGELKQAKSTIDAYLLRHLSFNAAGRGCSWQPGAFQVEDLSSGRYLHVPVNGRCAAGARELTTEYRVLFDRLPSHRAFLRVHADSDALPARLAPSSPSHSVDLESTSTHSVWRTFLHEGILHIWMGYDHLAFLLALIFPLFLNRRTGHAQTPRPARDIVLDVIRVVTAFTLAHTLTLILASTLELRFNATLIEAAIALSVVLSGINMLYPIFSHGHWRIAFGFGLIHGFGFAGVLADLMLDQTRFFTSLLSFNAGVELGQLMIVTALFPLLYVLRTRPSYGLIIVPGIAVWVIAFGLWWTATRLL